MVGPFSDGRTSFRTPFHVGFGIPGKRVGRSPRSDLSVYGLAMGRPFHRRRNRLKLG